MNKLLVAAALAVAALTGCSYATEEACLDDGHAACHVGALDGKWHAGTGIPIDSPAGAALINGLMPAPSYNVYVHPWY